MTPKALSKKKVEPISLTVSGKIATADGTQPPALVEAVIDTDRAGTIDARGVPTCKEGQLEAQPTTAAKKACPTAIVGTGTTEVEVLFPESDPILIHSQLTAFNGGTTGGNGAGSVTAFSLTFPKKLFAYKGTKHGYLLAKCANGRFLAQPEVKFSDGDKLGPAEITRACTPKG